MKFEDIFDKPESEDAPEKEEASSPKSDLPVPKNPTKAGERKGRVIINRFAKVGEDRNGAPIKAWVQRERQLIADDIIRCIKKQGIEIFNTNGYVSSYDKSSDNWYIYDDPPKVGVLIDTHVICLKKAYKNKVITNQPIDSPKNVNEFVAYSRDIISQLNEVVGVARHPYFDRNLNVVNTPGYNKEMQYYLPESCVIDKDAYNMTIKEAYDVFDEAFGCMNYKEDVDKQADFAAFLTPPWKMLIGNSPIISVTSNAPGSGKGLRQRIFNSVWSNNKGAVISKPKTEDELRKQLFSALRSGVNIISVDNISDKLLSDVVATYTTEPYISDRAVYGRKLEHYKNILFISVNGNNLRFSEDIATRVLPIRLDINQSSLTRDYKKEGRKTEPEIMSYADNNRDKIIGASLRISQEYIDKGMPELDTGASRFEKWRRCVLGSAKYAMSTMGMKYMLSNVVILAKQEADPESLARATLWKAILDIIGVEDNDSRTSKPFVSSYDSIHGIFDIASHFDKVGSDPSIGHDLLGEHINGSTERSRMTQVGVYFRDVAIDKIHYGWRLIKAENKLRIKRALRTTYRLVQVDDGAYVPGTENWERPYTSSVDALDDVPL